MLKTKTENYDVVIIGAGPIGLACAIACTKRKLSYVVIEKGALVNSLFNYPLNMTFFSTSERLEIGDVPFISHNPKPTRDEALEYYRRVALHWRVNLRLFERVLLVTPFESEKVKGEVRSLAPNVAPLPSSSSFIIKTDKSTYKASNIVISTGFYDIPNLLNIPGEDLLKVHHYYKEPHLYFGQKIVVVGAANSAVDVALECYRKGAEVTMVIRESAIGDNVKYWVKPDIENRIKSGEVKAFFNAELTEISANTVRIREKIKEEVRSLAPNFAPLPSSSPLNNQVNEFTLDNDFVLAMTGYQPDFTFLRSMGVELDPTDGLNIPVHNRETMETNVPGVFLAGVICGGMQTNKWFIENSRVHADMVAETIAGRRQNSL
ncbi:MAG: FAD-binding protein [Sphingobacteriales bacterium]|nr:MAG: FAD-binding protein [Sphingobacteriales bacterium]